MPIKFDTTIMRLIKDVNDIKAALRHVTTNLPLFDIANENSPDEISTDQNNYPPGNYDVLRINATENISITGFANGKKGRFLEVVNVGTGRISYPDESANSIAINRISTPYDQSIVQLPNARVRFYYDSTNERWTVADLPNIQGSIGRHAVLASVDLPYMQEIPDLEYRKIQPTSILSDEWGYWDDTNKKFVIPDGENGLYSISLNFIISPSVAGVDYYFLLYPIINAVGDPPSSGRYLNYHRLDANAYNSYGGTVNVIYTAIMEGGDDLTIYAYHNLSADVKIAVLATDSPVFTFSKVG